ncbi:hypothetical protein HC761_01430 [bacterium]|nr:hypothetical protein [bacterium]
MSRNIAALLIIMCLPFAMPLQGQGLDGTRELKAYVKRELFYGAPGFGESATDPTTSLWIAYVFASDEKSLRHPNADEVSMMAKLQTFQLLAAKISAEGCYQIKGKIADAETGTHFTQRIVAVSDVRPAQNCFTDFIASSKSCTKLAESFVSFWRRFREQALNGCEPLQSFIGDHWNPAGKAITSRSLSCAALAF